MSLPGLFWRFAAIYVGVVVAVSTVVGVLQIDPGSVDGLILFAVSFGVAAWYCRRNGRSLSGGELFGVALGFTATDLTIQIVFAYVVLAASGRDPEPGWMGFVILWIGGLHLLVVLLSVWFASWSTGRQLAVKSRAADGDDDR